MLLTSSTYTSHLEMTGWRGLEKEKFDRGSSEDRLIFLCHLSRWPLVIWDCTDTISGVFIGYAKMLGVYGPGVCINLNKYVSKHFKVCGISPAAQPSCRRCRSVCAHCFLAGKALHGDLGDLCFWLLEWSQVSHLPACSQFPPSSVKQG